MSQTKATKIIKAFHDNNNLTSSTLKAILENNNQLFLDTVKQAGLTVDDLTLSDVEFDDLVKGTKPSGELDIITWDGYYEVDVGPETDPRAFLILSTTEKVYWGSRSQLMGVPGDYLVDYSLTSDGKLILSTPADGTVSISLSRTFDDETGITVQVSGVCNGQSFSGSQVSPPLKSDPKTSAIFSTTRLTHRTVTIEDSTLSWVEVFDVIGSWLSIFMAIGYFYQMFRWVKDAEARRAEKARRLAAELEARAPVIEEAGQQEARSFDVNWDSAWETLTSDITTGINGILDHEVNFVNQTPDQIVDSLRERAKVIAETSLNSYVKRRIGSQIFEILDPFTSLPSYEGIRAQVMTQSIYEKANPKIQDIEGDNITAYDPIIRALTLEARKNALRENYEAYKEAYNGANAAYEEAKRQREITDQSIKQVDAVIEKAREENDEKTVEAETQRKKELEDQLDRQKADEEAKNEAKNDALENNDRAQSQSEEAKNEADHDQSRSQWNGIGEGIFGRD